METAFYVRDRFCPREGAATFTTTHWSVVLAAGEVASFDALDFQPLATLEGADVSAVTSLSFSPDDTRLAVSTTKPSIQYWNLRLVREQLAELNLDYPRPPFPAQQVSPRGVVDLSVAEGWPSRAGLVGHDLGSAPRSRVR